MTLKNGKIRRVIFPSTVRILTSEATCGARIAKPVSFSLSTAVVECDYKMISPPFQPQSLIRMLTRFLVFVSCTNSIAVRVMFILFI